MSTLIGDDFPESANPRHTAPVRHEHLVADRGRYWWSGSGTWSIRGMPSLSALLRLAEALGVRVERFAEGVEDPQEVEPAPSPEEPRRHRKGKAR